MALIARATLACYSRGRRERPFGAYFLPHTFLRLELTQAGFMQKIILMSVIYATAIIPLLAARDTSARRGLRRAIAWLLAFNVIYLLAVVFLYPHFS